MIVRRMTSAKKKFFKRDLLRIPQIKICTLTPNSAARDDIDFGIPYHLGGQEVLAISNIARDHGSRLASTQIAERSGGVT